MNKGKIRSICSTFCVISGIICADSNSEQSAPSTEPQASLSDTLIKNNPFIPSKSGVASGILLENANSDLKLQGYVQYEDSEAFCLKNTTTDKSFWLSSKNTDNENGIYFRAYDSEEKILTLQTQTGDLVSIRLSEPRQVSTTEKNSTAAKNSVDWLSFLDSLDDDDDDEPKGGKGAKG